MRDLDTEEARVTELLGEAAYGKVVWAFPPTSGYWNTYENVRPNPVQCWNAEEGEHYIMFDPLRPKVSKRERITREEFWAAREAIK